MQVGLMQVMQKLHCATTAVTVYRSDSIKLLCYYCLTEKEKQGNKKSDISQSPEPDESLSSKDQVEM